MAGAWFSMRCMARRTHDLILAIIETDRTFARVVVRGQEVWGGKCIHCKAHLYVGLDGRPVSRATIEHIRPRTHGGTDDLENLALACARCNNQKGSRLDNRAANDPALEAMVQRLSERRMERWRGPGREGGRDAARERGTGSGEPGTGK